MRHLVQFSTGVGSAEVAFRVVDEHGADAVTLVTADTRVEDPDNWRFAHHVVNVLGPVEWVVLADGRTPMEAGRSARVVPNNRMAVCSRMLKRDLIRAYVDDHYDPADALVHLGFDWTETHRLDASRAPWQPFTISAPLCDPPYLTKYQLLDGMRKRGIEPPRLYAAGFSHANCGGGCVRGGQAQWARLLTWNRERYLEWESDEIITRAMLDRDVSILKDRRGGETVPLTLTAFRERLEYEPTLFDADDEGACGCFSDAQDATA